jgi:hypothetical protein
MPSGIETRNSEPQDAKAAGRGENPDLPQTMFHLIMEALVVSHIFVQQAIQMRSGSICRP